MFPTQLFAAAQRADAARSRIAEATAGDREWLLAAQTPYRVAHCYVPATSAQRWDAIHALEEMAAAAEHSERGM